MPKSKRDKKISLTRTTKQGSKLKQSIMEKLRDAVDHYENIFVFYTDNMRNGKLKDVRNEWKDSRFFFGKNKVMAYALGKTAQEEIHNNLHKLAQKIEGQCGLLFTNRPVHDVVKWFENYSEPEYPRAGTRATYSVILNEGPLPDSFIHSMEPSLRELGLPTSLQRGVIQVLKEHTICKEGALITPEQSRLLKLFGHKMAMFKITMKYAWSKDGSFHTLFSE
ncbi:mRNA turnover protein 4 homolog [Daktulosphaira vitifoliae]|uniref:mRNA turnover protein 4 homolog n=1 Tax=Daktulosphaira vitifoliae TaxID=58002 RepID=UPI0021AA5C45|nr:mRNA turnover protein 4 homolog [Daktulosphaira vitifoliae]